jgi:divalent metal cation (Fe/Co/Zn/Cd) transporter
VIFVYGFTWYEALGLFILAAVVFSIVWTGIEIALDALLDRMKARRERQHLDELNAAPADIVEWAKLQQERIERESRG